MYRHTTFVAQSYAQDLALRSRPLRIEQLVALLLVRPRARLGRDVDAQGAAQRRYDKMWRLCELGIRLDLGFGRRCSAGRGRLRAVPAALVGHGRPGAYDTRSCASRS